MVGVGWGARLSFLRVVCVRALTHSTPSPSLPLLPSAHLPSPFPFHELLKLVITCEDVFTTPYSSFVHTNACPRFSEATSPCTTLAIRTMGKGIDGSDHEATLKYTFVHNPSLITDLSQLSALVCVQGIPSQKAAAYQRRQQGTLLRLSTLSKWACPFLLQSLRPLCSLPLTFSGR